MVSPSTIEDIERDGQMSSRISQVNDILSLISEVVTDEGKIETLKSLLSGYLNLSDVAGIVEKYNILENEDVGDEDIDFEGNFEGGDFGGTDFGDSNEPDFDAMNMSEEPPAPREEPSDTNITPEA